MTNQNPTTGAGNIKKFLMTSNKGQGKTADLSGGLVEYSYYESVLSNHITATAVIVETGVGQKGAQKGILDDLPIRGGERTLIEVTDSSSKQTPITLPDGLYVNRVRGSIPESQQDVYAIDFASKEYFLNEQSRVMKRYEGKISDNVETILNDVLKTTGSVEVDETSLPYNFYGMNKKPFYICTWLASKGVPTKGVEKTGGFLFFQTREGLFFKSIDNLFGQETSKKFIYNNTGILPAEYDANILSFEIKSDIELDQQLHMGAYNTRAIFFDLFHFSYEVIDFTIEEQEGEAENAGKDYINVNKDFIEEPSRVFFHLMDYGANPVGSGDEQLDNIKEGTDPIPNFDAKRSMVQTAMRYNQMFTVQTNITIPGDFSIKAGDIVECTFPDIESKRNKEDNRQQSGKYMVAHVCHKITPSNTYSCLGLVRDSFGKKGGF